MRCSRPETGQLLARQEALLADLQGCRPRSSEERAGEFAAPPAGCVEDRWHVYAHGYLARLEEALALDYRAVKRLVGAGPFADLVRRYASACPPRSFDLARAGDRLPEQLAGDPLAELLPFLPDVARLERAVGEAFVAADAEPLTWPELQAMGGEALMGLRLGLRPGTALVRSGWPLGDLWAARDVPDEEVAIDLDGRPQPVLVRRPLWGVRCDVLDEDAAAIVMLAQEQGSVSLSDLHAMTRWSDDANGVRRLLESVRRLTDLGIFIREGGQHG